MKLMRHSSSRQGCAGLPAVSRCHQCVWPINRKWFKSARQTCAASDSQGGSGMSPEEEAFYLEHLARKREERQRAIKEAARRSKLYASNRKANEQSQQTGSAVNKPAANPNPTDLPTLSRPSLPNSSTGTLPTPSAQQHSINVALNPKPQPTDATRQPTLTSTQHVPKSKPHTQKQAATSTSTSRPTAVTSAVDNASSTSTSQPTTGNSVSRTSNKSKKRVGLPRNPLTSRGKAVRLPSNSSRRPLFLNDEDSDDDDEIDTEELAEMNEIAAQILATGKYPSDIKSVSMTRQQPAKQMKNSSSPSLNQQAASSLQNVSNLPAGTRRTASSSTQPTRGSQGKASGQAGSPGNMSMQAEAQLMQKLQAIIDEDSDSDDDDDGNITKKDRLVNMDDIDWDALAAYENIEQSMSEQARVTTRLFSSTTGGPSDLDTAQPLKRPAALPQQPPASESTLSTPARKPSSATQSPRLFNQDVSTVQTAGNNNTSSSKTSADEAITSQPSSTVSPKDVGDVTDVDSLLQLLDQVEQGTLPAVSRDTGNDLSALEQLYLGKEWQDKELAGLPQASGTDYSEAQPWCDEVSSLLVGLVLLSSKRHLKQELLPESTPEEARATAVWEAPWALIVLDDSQKASLEYANQAALRMLGISDFLDVYDLTMYDLLSSGVDDQQEWLWALNEIESQEKTHLMLPQLQLQTRSAADSQPQAKTVQAKNVQLFRIDSLGEEGYVGTAVLIKDWQVV